MRRGSFWFTVFLLNGIISSLLHITCVSYDLDMLSTAGKRSGPMLARRFRLMKRLRYESYPS